MTKENYSLIVADSVKQYLDLVERESKKETPSRDIITANLKIASKISDSFIARTLNKPSNVVEGWIDALFLQKIPSPHSAGPPDAWGGSRPA